MELSYKQGVFSIFIPIIVFTPPNLKYWVKNTHFLHVQEETIFLFNFLVSILTHQGHYLWLWLTIESLGKFLILITITIPVGRKEEMIKKDTSLVKLGLTLRNTWTTSWLPQNASNSHFPAPIMWRSLENTQLPRKCTLNSFKIDIS